MTALFRTCASVAQFFIQQTACAIKAKASRQKGTNMKPIERLLEKLSDAKKCGTGWSARCPAHDDRRASLSVGVADDDRLLVHCHAGCKVQAICESVGLTLADLFTPSSRTPTPRSAEMNSQSQTRISAATNGTTFATPHDAVAELEHQLGPKSAQWTYHDAGGNPHGVVVRWNGVDGRKEIRPVSRDGDRWRIGAMPSPRPLYGLPDLASAETVYVVEGEKAADAARSIELTATTSAHGANSASKTDWTPPAGKQVVILPDNDDAGERYACDILTELAKLSPAPVVKSVRLPGLPDHGDIVEWIDAHGDAAEPTELRLQIEDLVAAADLIGLHQETPSVSRFQPFPTDALPEPVRGFVVAGSKAIGCDASYLALPMLTVLAAAIGNTRRIRLKRGWEAPAILWAAIVGESGTAKTPAFKLVMQPIRRRQRQALDRYAEAMEKHKIDLAWWEKDFVAWKRDKKTTEDPPAKPEPPQAERFYVSDTTVEALAPILLFNPRGVLVARDELTGWIGSFDRYAGGKAGADAAHWLSMHNGETIVVDRKTGEPRTIFVPQASVSLCGGIQPGILNRALGTEHRESGLAARLLLTFPPRKVKRWTEADIDPAAEAEITRLMDRLYELQPTVGDDDEPRAVVVGLTPDAKAAWTAYYDAHAEEQVDLAGELAAAWSKLEEYAARLALVIHFTRWAAGDPALNADLVDAQSIAAGVKIAQWFKGETRRVYAILGETDDDGQQRQLVEWIERKGGTVTAREVQQGCRWLRESGAAEAALDDLKAAGYGDWMPTPPGQRGQPAKRFRLSTASTVYGNSKTVEEDGNTVDVDGVDAAPVKPASLETVGARVDAPYALAP